MRATALVMMLLGASLSCGRWRERPAPASRDAGVACVDVDARAVTPPAPMPPPTSSARVAPRTHALAGLVRGSTTRVVELPDGTSHDLEELARLPPCEASSEALLVDRIVRASAVFSARKDLGDRRGFGPQWIGIGCEERGAVLVSMALPIGIGETVEATYLVDEHRAKPLVPGTVLAHVDLDGDGRRDVVWQAPEGLQTAGMWLAGHRLTIRFAASGEERRTSVAWIMPEDSESEQVGAPVLDEAFGIVVTSDTFDGSRVDRRLLWNGRRLVPTDRLEPAFEARLAKAIADDAFDPGRR